MLVDCGGECKRCIVQFVIPWLLILLISLILVLLWLIFAHPELTQRRPSQEIKEPSPEPTKTITKPEISSLTRVRTLLLDPAVLSIECPGPLRQIIINRKGQIQPVNLTLTPREIRKVLGEFSEKTRIPLIKGIFKAVLGQLNITAVISDYVGTRFIIQKRMPL